MENWTPTDWGTVALALMGMLYLTCKTFEFFVGLTLEWGWHKWDFHFSKNKQEKALAAMQSAFDVRPEVIGKVKAFNLSNNYILMFINKEHIDSIIKKEDEICGTSSTTPQSSDSSPTQE